MSLYWEKHIHSDIDIFGFRDRPYYGLNIFVFFFKMVRTYDFLKKWRIIKHAKELLVLEKEGLLGDYYEFLRQYNAYSNQASAQNFYYFQFIQDKFIKQDNLDFLEIGAGGGIFAMLCFEKLSVKHYVIIDLPPMLEVAKNNILKHRPGIIKYITFLTPNQKPEKTYDAFFNFNSFCEMEERTIAEYFNLIYSIAKPNALFFNVNYHRKIKNKDKSISDNNPLLFPYRGKRIVWKTDEMSRSKKPLGFPAYIYIERIP